MNGKRYNRCEVCVRRAPRDWEGVPANRCRKHRVSAEVDNAAEVNAVGSKSRAAIGMGMSAIFGALVGVIAIIAETLPDSGDRQEDRKLRLSDIAHYPGKEYDDAGKPLGWVGHGHDPDTDRHFGPPSDWV